MNQNEDFPSSLVADFEPPRGSEWDARLDSATLAFFDLEMSGLDPTRNHIVEVAVIRERGGNIVEEFSSKISATHQNHDDATRRADTSPTFASIAPRLQSLLQHAVPIAHGTSLDLQFLRAEFRTAGWDPTVVTWALDTLVLARRAVVSRGYSLPALTKSLGLPPRDWHHAREDALGARALFHRIAPAFGPTTPRDLWQVRIGQQGPVVVRDSIARAIEAALHDATPRVLVIRARGNPEARLAGVIERWRRPHAWLALEGGGLRVVRADRILRVEPAPLFSDAMPGR